MKGKLIQMVYLDNLKEYVEGKENTGLINIVPTYEVLDEGLFNTKLVETYIADTEDSASTLINTAKENKDFFSVMKKYKNPKYNKEGELLKEGYYIIKLTFKHNYKED